jgi:hypothetical protein
LAQNQLPEPNVEKLIMLKYADPRAIENVLRVFGVQITLNEQMKVIAISGRKDKVASAEEAVKAARCAFRRAEEYRDHGVFRGRKRPGCPAR